MLSLVVAAVAGILGFLQHRRGAARDATPDVFGAGAHWALWATAAVAIGLMAASGTLHLTGLESVSAEEKVGAIGVDIKNSTFEPDQVTVPAGRPARFVIKNRDLTVHTFTIEELGIDVKVLPGSEELVELPSPPAGTYAYSCTAGTGFSLPLHKPEVESDPSVPSDFGTLVVSEP